MDRRVGRTPGLATWSARVPPDPLFAQENQPQAFPERPTGGRPRVRPALEDKWTAS
jgi:hypothetical protein